MEVANDLHGHKDAIHAAGDPTPRFTTLHGQVYLDDPAAISLTQTNSVDVRVPHDDSRDTLLRGLRSAAICHGLSLLDRVMFSQKEIRIHALKGAPHRVGVGHAGAVLAARLRAGKQ